MPERKKNVWKEITSALGIDILSIKKKKQCIILSELGLWNRQEVYETDKKLKSFPFKAATSSLPVIASL